MTTRFESFLISLTLMLGAATCALPAHAQSYEFKRLARTLVVSTPSSAPPSGTPSGSTEPAPAAGGATAGSISLSTELLAFSEVNVGASAWLDVQISNGSGHTVRWTQPPAITGDGSYSSSTSCGETLAPSSACYVRVTFAPLTAGDKAATLTLATDSTTPTRQVSLTGLGRQLTGSLSANSGSATSFGNVPVNSTVTASFTFTLTGAGSASGVYPAVPNGAVLSTTQNNCGVPYNPRTMSAGQSCSFTLTFSPVSPGSWSGSLRVLGNYAASPSAVDLSANVTAAYAVFTASDCASISNGGLTVSGPTAASPGCGARTNLYRTSGKYYFEATNTSTQSYNPVVGLHYGGAAYDGSVTAGFTPAKNVKYGFAVDVANKTITVLNVTAGCTLETTKTWTTTTAVTPGVATAYSGDGKRAVFNFGQSAFSCLPAGYAAGWF